MADRIVSLLPSATEILWFLGLGQHVVGVTYECREPTEAASRPHVTDTIIPTGSSPAEIDSVIKAAVAEGRELYQLDRNLLASLDPDLIVTQDLCRVCALPAGDVDAAVAALGCEADVFSYDPMTLTGVLDAIRELALVAGASNGPELVEPLRARLGEIQARVEGAHRPKVLLLEWTDPPFSAGHWIPDQVVAAGGEAVLAHPGQPSGEISWHDVGSCEADVLVVAPCGFDEAGALDQLAAVVARPEVANLPAVRNGRVHAIDADSYVVRPGPRLIDGVEILARLIHPDRFPLGSPTSYSSPE